MKIGDYTCGKTGDVTELGWVTVDCPEKTQVAGVQVPLEGDSIKILSGGNTALAVCGIRVEGTNCWDRDSCADDVDKAFAALEAKQHLEFAAKNAYDVLEE